MILNLEIVPVVDAPASVTGSGVVSVAEGRVHSGELME